MKHWSDNYIEFISVKIEYEDGSAQWWDFESIQYDTLEGYKNDIARDLVAVDQQYQGLEVLVRGQDNQQYLFEMNRNGTEGMDFAELVLDYAEAMLNGN